jgi:ferredoxin
MDTKRSGAIALCVAVSACAAQTELFWVRTDGKPVLANQFEVDRTLCNGEVGKSAQPMDVFGSCMAQMGYRQQAVE